MEYSRIRTIAGTGAAGFSGDGGPATEAQLANPFGIVIGPDGALYIGDIDNHRIRRLDMQTGVITTVAGNGEDGDPGDGGPAIAVPLREPYELRFDRDGTLFFVDMKNHAVFAIDSHGTLRRVAGTGEAGFSGDGGPAVAAMLNQPHSIELDDWGGLYIADIGNHRVRRVDLASGVIETVAGTGEREPTPDGAPLAGTPLNGPRALAFRAPNNLYLALREGNAVYRIDLGTKTIHHVAGTGARGASGDGGPAKEATFFGPKGIAVGPNGEVVLADTENQTIRCIDPDGTIRTVAGSGEKTDGPDGDPLGCGLVRPHGVFVADDGRIYIGDSENHRVRVLE